MSDVSSVCELIERDHWVVREGLAENGLWVLRVRDPLLQPHQTASHPCCIRVVWEYAQQDLGAMPDDATLGRLDAFEDLLCASWESDATAVLTAVLTLDGARQWVFYSADVDECGNRLNALPQEREPYPLELDAFDDKAWDYLREIVDNADDA